MNGCRLIGLKWSSDCRRAFFSASFITCSNSFRLPAVSTASSTETRPSDMRGSAPGMTLRVQYRMRFNSANSALISSSFGRRASRSASSRVRSAFSAMRCSLSRGDASPSDFKSPEQLYLDKEKLLALYDAMNRSSLRDAAWIRHRFGFDGKPCALAAAARDYGLSISRARRIEDEALRHIRENLAAQSREKAAA